LRAGDLKHLIDIQEATLVADGMGGQTTTWANVSGLSGLRAAIWPLYASERLEAMQLEHAISHRIRIYYRPGLNADMRVVLDKGGERIASIVNRDFSAASAWTNATINAYNETGDLTITASAAGQYCYLPVASAPMTKGCSYKLSFTCSNLVGQWYVYDYNATHQISQTVTGGGATNTFYFTYRGTGGGGIRLTSVGATSSGDFDNFSLREARLFNIKSIINADERNVSLELLCEEVN